MERGAKNGITPLSIYGDGRGVMLFTSARMTIQSFYRSIFTIFRDLFCVVLKNYNFVLPVKAGISRSISFGDSCIGIYGDRKYDLAKLLHSATGGYDYLANDLFELTGDGDELALRFNFRDNQLGLQEAARALIADLGAREDEIMLLVALLFLSMCPLHADSRARQVAMYAHGLRLLNEALV